MRATMRATMSNDEINDILWPAESWYINSRTLIEAT
jgi:hypothetical protein